MKKSFILILSLVTLIGVITYTLATNKKKIDASKVVVDRSKIAVAVSTASAAYQDFDGKVVLPANLELNSEATIAVGIQGKIEKLSIEVGSRVAKGQVVGSLDSKLKQLNLKANELTLSKLERDLQRNDDLFKGNAGTELSVINGKYDIENTRLQLEQVKQQIADGNIVAPITGIITSRKLMAGEFVSPGAVIATVVDDVHLKAVVFVNEKNVYQLRLGQKASITTDIFPNKSFVGTVKFISPKGDENHNYRVELQLNTNELRAGTYVMVGFDLGGKVSVLQIPKLALVEGEEPFVYVVKNNVDLLRKLPF
ncbi:MAG: efflux RND transporter periplasmic adaptor subunit [Spirosomataceae bacterium]